jgi:uncharacterized protein
MPRSQRIAAVATVATTATASVAAVGGAVFLLADRFVRELSRPGMSIADDASVWGSWRFPEEEMPPLEFRRPVIFHAADGTQLRGEFWAQPKPAPTIILSHGFRVPCAKFRPVAALEYRHGANILLFDYRGHGESEHIPTSGGIAEVRDLLAAIAVAAAQPETLPQSTFIHGFSMGAAVALLLPPHAEIAGIIADSPYARLDAFLHRVVTSQLRADSARWPRALQLLRTFIPLGSASAIAGGEVIFRLRFRHALVARPAARLRTRRRQKTATLPPLLLIHAKGDTLIPLADAEIIAQAAQQGGYAITTYYAESHTHCGAYGADPELYIAHMRDFMDRHR